ncbi:FFLEELY motif protein [Reinekea marinisedimentorum]|uniref:DUF8198 domain-containing protein n=1 Tax=Reinekea marinisedimentorum TaxID=230495 RepID=A0A4R3I7I0_9GAMM|nr:hypothetical protein [Reinekea marinisedimentorum]TCS41987.1 hypothetical protein BCF53_10491 [Reinekea marinisedimentorum]
MRKTSKQFEKAIHNHLSDIQNIRITPTFRQLQRWQSERLFDTHRELYQQPKFQPAMRFFSEELYGTEHFMQRNNELIKALPLMCRTMPAQILRIVENAALLQRVSLQLDAQLLTHLPAGISIEHLTLQQWVQAYAQCDNRPQRQQQLDLIESIGNDLAAIIHIPMITALLNWAEKPAKLAGYGEIHHFVITGFRAFKRLKNPQDFLQPVISKERQLSGQWFAQASSSSLRAR